jgi:hypothetical protein
MLVTLLIGAPLRVFTATHEQHPVSRTVTLLNAVALKWPELESSPDT